MKEVGEDLPKEEEKLSPELLAQIDPTKSYKTKLTKELEELKKQHTEIQGTKYVATPLPNKPKMPAAEEGEDVDYE